MSKAAYEVVSTVPTARAYGQAASHSEEIGWAAIHPDDIERLRAIVQDAIARRSEYVDAFLESFAIITCPANELVAQIHERMPTILHPQDRQHWLSVFPPTTDLLKPFRVSC